MKSQKFKVIRKDEKLMSAPSKSLEEISEKITQYQDGSDSSFYQIGCLLVKAKEMHGEHGDWLKWLQERRSVRWEGTAPNARCQAVPQNSLENFLTTPYEFATSIAYNKTPSQVNFVLIDVGASDLMLF